MQTAPHLSVGPDHPCRSFSSQKWSARRLLTGNVISKLCLHLLIAILLPVIVHNCMFIAIPCMSAVTTALGCFQDEAACNSAIESNLALSSADGIFL